MIYVSSCSDNLVHFAFFGNSILVSVVVKCVIQGMCMETTTWNTEAIHLRRSRDGTLFVCMFVTFIQFAFGQHNRNI